MVEALISTLNLTLMKFKNYDYSMRAQTNVAKVYKGQKMSIPSEY